MNSAEYLAPPAESPPGCRFLMLPERCESATRLRQLSGCTIFHHSTAVQNNHSINVLQTAEPVGHDDTRL